MHLQFQRKGLSAWQVERDQRSILFGEQQSIHPRMLSTVSLSMQIQKSSPKIFSHCILVENHAVTKTQYGCRSHLFLGTGEIQSFCAAGAHPTTIQDLHYGGAPQQDDISFQLQNRVHGCRSRIRVLDGRMSAIERSQ